MSLSEQLSTLATVADRLNDLGVDVEEIGDVSEYSHRDQLLVDIQLAIPATLDATEGVLTS